MGMEEALPGEGRTGYTGLPGPGGAQAFRLFFWSGKQLACPTPWSWSWSWSLPLCRGFPEAAPIPRCLGKPLLPPCALGSHHWKDLIFENEDEAIDDLGHCAALGLWPVNLLWSQLGVADVLVLCWESVSPLLV